MTYQRWNNLISKFGITKDDETYNDLISRYSENHRFYHTIKHVKHMLEVFDNNIHLVHNKNEVEMAIWFHDAIYDIQSKSNELDSALLAKKFLSKHGISKDIVKRIYDLILSTKHDSNLVDMDQRILTDIDLSILGTNEETFDNYELNIRKEYSTIDKDIYDHERFKILNMFYNKESIYYTNEFTEIYETQARYNLKRSINQLHA